MCFFYVYSTKGWSGWSPRNFPGFCRGRDSPDLKNLDNFSLFGTRLETTFLRESLQNRQKSSDLYEFYDFKTAWICKYLKRPFVLNLWNSFYGKKSRPGKFRAPPQTALSKNTMHCYACLLFRHRDIFDYWLLLTLQYDM